MTFLRFLAALLLWVAAGRAVFRWTVGDRLALSWPATGCAWLVCGVVTTGVLTTLLASLGLPVRPWPLTAPLMVLIAASRLPRRRAPREAAVDRGRRKRRQLWLGQVPAFAVAALSVPYLWTAAGRRTVSNDEYAIWAFKGKIFTTVGRADPFLLAKDPLYSYASRDYPLLLPSIQVWVEGWIGHQDDLLTHFALALLIASAFVLFAELVHQLAGVAAALVSVIAVLATVRIVYNATLFMGDATVCVLGLLVVAALALAAQTSGSQSRGWTSLCAVLAAGLAITKNEGIAYVFAFVLSGILFFPRGSRRQLLAPLLCAVLALLPWAIWSRAHGLHSDFVNTATVTPTVIARNLSRLHPLLHAARTLWPGPTGLALGAVLVSVLCCLIFLPHRRKLIAFILVGSIFSLAALLLTYLVAPHSGIGFWSSNLPRVLLFPAAVAWMAGAISTCLLFRPFGCTLPTCGSS